MRKHVNLKLEWMNEKFTHAMWIVFIMLLKWHKLYLLSCHYISFLLKKKLLVVLTIVNNVLDNICTVQDIYVFHSTEAF